jgi:transposase
MLLEINENYYYKYYLKEEYFRFNKNATPENDKEWLETIIQSFIEADILEYGEFVITITNWKQGIINSFQRPYQNNKLSNTLVDNINGQIIMFFAVSKGSTNFFRFRKRIL